MSYHWPFVLSFLIAVLLADFVTTTVHWDEMWVKHTWNAVPANWESLGDPPAGAIINLHIALKPDRERALIDALFEVSNPKHPRYGLYLSKKQVAELVSPPAETLDLVRAWLIHCGVRPSSFSTTHGGSWLTITGVLVSQANQLLGASYQLYQNSKTNHTILRTVGYALPAVLHTHILTVAPTTYFPYSRRMRQTPRDHPFGEGQTQAAPGKLLTVRDGPGIMPSVLRWLYKTREYRPTATDRNWIGILGIENEYPSEGDLASFMAKYRSNEEVPDLTVVQWNGGGYNTNNPGLTANIGVQYAAGMANPTPLVFYSVGGDAEWSPGGGWPIAGDMYREWLRNLLEEEVVPATISISYGEPEQGLPEQYAHALCTLFGQLGGRGVTVLAASGQDGVGAGDCVNAQGNVRFMPEFPASCPYLTSVGGTLRALPEVAANLSGGGFSLHFERENYQELAVADYFRQYPRIHDGLFNRNGRGFPDISAQAVNYKMVMNGENSYVDGTACAVSTVAGIVSLLNDYLISNDKFRLGFLNVFLYEIARGGPGFAGIIDIKYGLNQGCATDGFPATAGWDPVTGLGTLDFQAFLTLLEFWPGLNPNDPFDLWQRHANVTDTDTSREEQVKQLVRK